MRVIIADDQAGVRSALRFLLEQQAKGCVISESSNTENLISQLIAGCPDIILLDAELEGIVKGNGDAKNSSFESLVSTLREQCPGVRVIALSSRPDLRVSTLCCGADAFVCKADPPEELLKVLQNLCSDDQPSEC